MGYSPSCASGARVAATSISPDFFSGGCVYEEVFEEYFWGCSGWDSVFGIVVGFEVVFS